MIPDRWGPELDDKKRISEQNIMDNFGIINLTIWVKWTNGQIKR